MSRIGKKHINIPAGVKIAQNKNKLTIEGPKGKLELNINQPVKVQVDESAKKLQVSCKSNLPQDKALYGTTRSLINNAIIGADKGYEKRVEIRGVGYNGKVQGKDLIINIGYTHPVKVSIPSGITVEIPNPNLLVFQSADKELVGKFSASIRAIKPCEPYNLKGIKYVDEVIKKKAGKTFVSGAT